MFTGAEVRLEKKEQNKYIQKKETINVNSAVVFWFLWVNDATETIVLM